MRKHEHLKICSVFWCPRCKVKLFKNKKANGKFESNEEVMNLHSCKITCKGCWREKSKAHKCYMTREGLRPRCQKLLFIDYETDQSTGTHIPIFCNLQWIVFKTNKTTGKEEIAHEGEKNFGVGYTVFREVGDFIFKDEKGTPCFNDFSVIGHNMKGFDGCFLLRYLIEENIDVSVVANGLKLTSLNVPKLNIRVIDSLNFLQMGLAAIPKAMGISSSIKSKGHFPHFFTNGTTLKYKGKLPEPEDYGIFDFEKNVEFRAWYEKTQEDADMKKEPAFDFDRDIRLYCRQDVSILKAGCIQFRKLVLEITSKIPPQEDTLSDDEDFMAERQRLIENDELDSETEDKYEGETLKHDNFDPDNGCDPFSYLTAPGMCAAIFKSKFLKKRSIAQINPAGYENFRHSAKSFEYLEYMNRKMGHNIKHALNTDNGREIALLDGRFRVDGYESRTKSVFEFNGCFWHGCPKCIKNRDQLHPVRGVTFNHLYEKTMQREQELKDNGYNVNVMWECEWDQIKKADEEIKKLLSEIHVKSRLNPRDAFRGGRVETGRIYYNIEDSEHKLGVMYFDICSLYPYVNCFEYYPVGHPEIITSNFRGLEEYFGLVQCSILPPRDLLSAVLPVHTSGKLLFPLCRTCADTLQVEPCEHSVEDRTLHGTWVSEELKLAVREGYQMIKIHAVHHFKRKSNKLFSNYIKTFFKVKLLASQRPENETPEELEKFIQETSEREGICIECGEEFEFNPGLRSIGKLCCNCMWGRLGMRDAFPIVSFCYDEAAVNKIVYNDSYKINSVRVISSKCVAVLHENRSPDLLNFSNNTNIYLAVFTTAFARMKLFELIKKAGSRFLYGDTDSIFFEASPNPEENFPTGSFMGDLTNELKPGEVIVEFVSGGPKVYGYRTSFGNVVVVVKGFQLNSKTKAIFTFQNLKRVVLSGFKKGLDPDMGRVIHRTMNLKAVRSHLFDKYHNVNPDCSSTVAVDDAISVFDVSRIHRDSTWQLFSKSEQKMYAFTQDKRIMLRDYHCVPYGWKPN